MKTRMILPACLLIVVSLHVSYAQDNRIEVPGDHFSLEGALELFKRSGSPEEFERLLNSKDAKVNNLDLNGDGDIDFIRVIDRQDGNIHAFILQAVVSERESQDVAVIELEKLANGKAVLQITGDADIYGTETIIEPTEEVRINAGTGTARSIVNVWTWPSVQYIYGPYYSSWYSPWRWSYYPSWWRPWQPVSYYVYRPWWQPYHPHYSVCHTRRIVYAHNLYSPYRSYSSFVYNRYHHQISRYRSDRTERNAYERSGNSRSDHRTYDHVKQNADREVWRKPSWDRDVEKQNPAGENDHWKNGRSYDRNSAGGSSNQWRDRAPSVNRQEFKPQQSFDSNRGNRSISGQHGNEFKLQRMNPGRTYPQGSSGYQKSTNRSGNSRANGLKRGRE